MISDRYYEDTKGLGLPTLQPYWSLLPHGLPHPIQVRPLPHMPCSDQIRRHRHHKLPPAHSSRQDSLPSFDLSCAFFNGKYQLFSCWDMLDLGSHLAQVRYQEPAFSLHLTVHTMPENSCPMSINDAVSMEVLSSPSLHSPLLCLLVPADTYHIVPFFHLPLG